MGQDASRQTLLCTDERLLAKAIESQFTALRKFALNNSDYHGHEEQQQAIESYLAWRNGRREIAIEPWPATYAKNANTSKTLHAFPKDLPPRRTELPDAALV